MKTLATACVLVSALLLAAPDSGQAFTVSSFNPAVVYSGTSPAEQAALDTAVGVSGYVIEDFEDAVLAPGLSMSPAPALGSTYTGSIWDGVSYTVHGTYAPGILFTFAGGAASVGFGIGDVDVEQVHLYVNDMDMGAINALPNFTKLGDNVRDVYIRVDAGVSESISTIRIQRDATDFNDGVFIDHLAFTAEPVANESETWGAVKSMYR